MAQTRLPDTAKCEGCGRPISVAKYISDLSSPVIPDPRVSRRVIPQAQPSYMLACLCGHCTVHAPFERSKRSAAKRERETEDSGEAK